jgi:hypothetical protein
VVAMKKNASYLNPNQALDLIASLWLAPGQLFVSGE